MIRILTLAMLMLWAATNASAYRWYGYGPDGVITYDYISHEDTEAFGTDLGLCIREQGQWNFYALDGMEVPMISGGSAGSLMVIMSGGNGQEGIYSFALNTHQFSLLAGGSDPVFLHRAVFNGWYYAGISQGTVYSTDGFTWSPYPGFETIRCTAMYTNGPMFCLSSDYTGYGYYSSDGGATWIQNQYCGFREYAFSGDTIRGVRAGLAQPGIWYSVDEGVSWEWEYIGAVTSSIFIAEDHRVFAGCHDYAFVEGGILQLTGWDQADYLNIGLSCFHVNRIRPLITGDTTFLMALTMEGAYFMTNEPTPPQFFDGYYIPHAANVIAAADINLDNHEDIITGHRYDPDLEQTSFSVLLNTGDGHMTIQDTSLQVDASIEWMILSPFDNDNYPDLAVIIYVYGQPLARIYLNQAGHFSSTQYSDFPLSLQDVDYIGDFASGYLNSDGHTDLLATGVRNMTERILFLMMNDGEGHFTDVSHHFLPVSGVCGHDFTGDGKDEILAGNETTSWIYSWGGGALTEIQVLDKGGDFFAVSDLDQDGDDDLLTGSDMFHKAYSWLNNGFPSFNFISETGVSYPYEVSVTEMDGDDLPDMVNIEDEGTVSIRPGNGGTFGAASHWMPQWYPCGIGWWLSDFATGDFDHNDAEDIAILLFSWTELPWPNLQILYNDGSGNFSFTSPLWTGIGEPTDHPDMELVAWPNPFREELRVSAPHYGGSKMMLRLYDLQGHTVRISGETSEAGGIWKLETSGLPAGIYILEVLGKEIHRTFRLVHL